MTRGRPRSPRYAPAPTARPGDVLPDARDGLTRLERVILVTLAEAQRERGDANVPTAMLYGRVACRLDVSLEEFIATLQRLIGTRVD